MRLVKPNATDDEINAAVNDTSNGQVFQQAELVRINETITELAQLMADMALYVEQQGNVIDTIEKTTEVVMKDTEKAYGHPLLPV
ncbi:3548_t:CDS:2 [Acaulospora colombiana]|uniref:3548_t:CDS:1 n=1 Tax=Acaulospora colombiana TaxID=27376 RepID=A0ACA9M0C7_9GLOM|nr:3548_t:CDS:2 [Acaulospora colombiana]